MTFQCFLSCLLPFLGFLFPFKPVVQTATHTRLPLNVAATNWWQLHLMVRKDRGSRALGGERRQGWEGAFTFLHLL